MYLFAILSSLICIQLISIASSEIHDPSQSSQSNILTPASIILDSESDEEYDYNPRSTSFLRFGRQLPPSYLRLDRSNLNFLRFGRANQNAAAFLRFGRRPQQYGSNKFLHFGRKGEFLRFG